MSIKLIGLGGKLRSGKDATADYLEAHHGFVKMGMSDALNEALLILNPWIPNPTAAIGLLGEEIRLKPLRYRDLHDAVGYVEAKKISEVRRLLQVLGTEVGREMISPNVWTDIAEKKIRSLWEDEKPVVITAMRFPNEVDMLKRLGGVSIWIDRPEEENDLPHNPATIQEHASENSVSPEMFTHYVENSGTLEDLYQKTEDIISLTTQERSTINIASGTPDTTGEIVIYPPYDR